MESISKLQATLFDPLSPDTLPRPPSLRKSHSPCSTHPARLAPFRETACSPRILISSKVLFPLNRAATRNNALYVRVLRVSHSLSRFVARLFLSRSLVVVLSLVSRQYQSSGLSSSRRTRNAPKFVPWDSFTFLINNLSHNEYSDSTRLLFVRLMDRKAQRFVFVCFRHVTNSPLT